MAEFIVRNSLNPHKVIKVGVTFNQVTPKGYEGEDLWVVEVATNETTVSGETIRPVYINNVTARTLDEEIANAIGILSAQVDWSPLLDDTREPIIESISPAEYEVDIESSVEISLQEILPAAGIDIDSITMTVNDFDVTDTLEITGDPYRYKVKWKPFLRIYDEE